MIFEISPNEKIMLQSIRELKPYESVSVQKDANGKPDYFIVHREQKVYLSEMTNKLSTRIP